MSDYYNFNHAKRGIAVVAVNVECTGFKPRTGAEKDIELLFDCFKSLRFDVRVLSNYKGDQLVTELKNIAKEMTMDPDFDCFVFAMSSHGDKKLTQIGNHTKIEEDVILASDASRIPTQTILELFSDENCEGLIGKPRLFFLQGGNQYSGESVLEFIDTFRTDKNTFISNNDKLHKWAMWRSRVNGSFIRNLPVTQDLPIDETTIREKRINIDRFMVHSDTDELKRLQMKDVYGHSNGYQSRLGHSTYFLYGIPRISTGNDIIEGKQVNRRKVHRFVDDESVRSRTPTPPPQRKQHFFVGSSQGANSVISDDHGLTLELSHALKSTSVFAKNLPEPLPYENIQQVEPAKSEASIRHSETPQFDACQYEIRHLVPQIVVPRLQYQTPPRYRIWKETHLIRDPVYELECQEGCVDFADDNTSSISGYVST